MHLINMEKGRAGNKRFAVMRGVCPQKVLSDFQAFTPARTFVFPRTTASRRNVSGKCMPLLKQWCFNKKY